MQSTTSFLRGLQPTIVFRTYWAFAVERQKIYFRRILGQPGPWSTDLVLQEHKFTNAFRAADRVSQYLIRNVIGEEPRSVADSFFRILLFKIFNRIDTWELLCSKVGDPCVSNFDCKNYGKILSEAFHSGVRLYSAAYIMPSGGGKSGFARKHEMHLALLQKMLDDQLPEKIAESPSMSHAFGLLRGYHTIGDFLAYQFIIDLNYSDITQFSEMEFVVPGPGARDGIKKCFSNRGNYSDADIIRCVTENQEECLRETELQFPTLWGRRLQLVDCQNLFCEVDKYSRVVHPEFSGQSGRTRIKQKLRPTKESPLPWFPPKWKINHLLSQAPLNVPID
jgi:alpha-glutamyl/putrescinyl thymine pyrophosphorylase clade 1